MKYCRFVNDHCKSFSRIGAGPFHPGAISKKIPPSFISDQYLGLLTN
jgi:hypothetical protein